MINQADGPAARTPPQNVYDRRLASVNQPTNLADLLERVLDKGIVIAGDITLSLGNVELLSLKIRLLIASIDKAQEIGINWWQSDPALSSQLRSVEAERDELRQRLERLEARLMLAPSEADAPPRPPA
jgi:hypothetical protein